MDSGLFVINIGREFGSGGKEIAFAIAERLGVKAYDTNIITETAKRSGFSTDLFKNSDEKVNKFPLLNTFGLPGIGTRNYLDSNELFRIQSDTIRHIAENESAVFIGRCADYILRNHPRMVNIFITAPKSVRAERVSTRENISLQDAEALIERKDSSRADYYNYYTFGAWGYAGTYHLCIDSSVMGIEGTTDFILDFINKKIHVKGGKE